MSPNENQQRKFLENIFDISPDAIIFVNEKQNIIRFNKGAEETFGYLAEEVLDKPLSVLLPEECCANHKKLVENFAKGAVDTRSMYGPINFDKPKIFGRRKNGSIFPADTSISRIVTDEGMVFIAILRDISDTCETIATAQKYVEQLKELNENKNKFLGIAAHDLRNPLAAIMGYAKLLNMTLGDIINTEQRYMINRIEKSANFMLSLVNDLLDFSAIESGNLYLNSSWCDIVLLVKETCTLFEMQANKKNIEIARDIPEQSCSIYMDENKIEQVLNNLIDNAIKFSNSDTSIHIKLVRKNDNIEISVKDQGPGILEQEKANVFQPFERVSNVPTGGENSTGLGLAIVKKIVDNHKGKIWFKSTPNKGTTFFILLPINYEDNIEENV